MLVVALVIIDPSIEVLVVVIVVAAAAGLIGGGGGVAACLLFFPIFVVSFAVLPALLLPPFFVFGDFAFGFGLSFPAAAVVVLKDVEEKEAVLE